MQNSHLRLIETVLLITYYKLLDFRIIYYLISFQCKGNSADLMMSLTQQFRLTTYRESFIAVFFKMPYDQAHGESAMLTWTIVCYTWAKHSDVRGAYRLWIAQISSEETLYTHNDLNKSWCCDSWHKVYKNNAYHGYARLEGQFTSSRGFSEHVIP